MIVGDLNSSYTVYYFLLIFDMIVIINLFKLDTQYIVVGFGIGYCFSLTSFEVGKISLGEGGGGGCDGGTRGERRGP